jgi:mRNA (guanine-N7-)-methyltransferase
MHQGRNVRDFYHEKPKQTRQEREASPLIHVRKFNNFIKSVVISTTLDQIPGDSLAVLDLCGGTGGDFPKFQHCRRVKEVALVDISPDSVAEAERRWRNGRSTFRAR